MSEKDEKEVVVVSPFDGGLSLEEVASRLSKYEIGLHDLFNEPPSRDFGYTRFDAFLTGQVVDNDPHDMVCGPVSVAIDDRLSVHVALPLLRLVVRHIEERFVSKSSDKDDDIPY